MKTKFVCYYRVSLQKQGIDGYGMDAQRFAAKQYLAGRPALREFSEVETGKHASRVQLDAAIALCKKERATLVIGRLDRLSRNAAFLLNLQESNVDFVCCDMPSADKFTIGVLALVAQREREMISERTKAALAAAKRRGIKIGNPRLAAARKLAAVATRKRADDFAIKLKPIIQQLRKAGITSLRGIAFCLNARGVKSPNGKAFSRQVVKAILNRIAG